MYFADAGAAATPDKRAARIGRTIAPIAPDRASSGTPVVMLLEPTATGVNGTATDAQDESIPWPGSESAACHCIWHPALVESIWPIGPIASLLDTPWDGIPPACIQQLEAEQSLPEFSRGQDAFARAGCAIRRAATTSATI
jgi:hypothetical protein